MKICCLNIPPVLYSGSCIQDNDLQRDADLGIIKINRGVGARSAFMKRLRESLSELDEKEKFPHKIFPRALEYHARCIREKIRVFKSEGKA